MKANSILKFLCAGIIIFSGIQCTSDSELDFIEENDNYSVEKSLKTSSSIDREIILGEKLENPYSVLNMQKAFNSIKNKYRGFENVSISIQPNYLYLRALPVDESELDYLKDLGYELYEYPLDREIIQEGSYYVDPELGEDKINWQYFVAPLGFKYPGNLQYELLSKLYLHEEVNLKSSGDILITTANTFRKDEPLVFKKAYDFDGYTLNDFIEDESLFLTNNLDATEKTEYSTQKAEFISTKRGRWRPSGTLKVNDDIAGIIPVIGAKGMATKWFKRGQGITNSNGYWQSSKKFRGKVRFKIKWDRYHYSIRRGQIGQANLRRGGRHRSNWNEIIDDNKRDKYHATIHQAAHDYYYGSRFGLSSPPRNSFFKTQMKIAARPRQDASSSLHPLRYFGVLPFVSINRYNSLTDEIYAVTAHELAHAAHWNMGRDDYNNLGWDGYIRGIDGDKRTMESWASGVEIMFALQRYRTQLGISDYDYEDVNFQNQSTTLEPIYTSIAYDMVDFVNQRSVYGNTRPLDRVSGYTIKQVEDGLRGARRWTDWRNNMISRHTNSTEQFIYELFCNWEGSCTNPDPIDPIGPRDPRGPGPVPIGDDIP